MNQCVRSVSVWRMIGLWLALSTAAWGSAAHAQMAGTVVHLTGTLSAQRAFCL